MIDHAEGLLGHRVDRLLQWKYSGSEAGPLVCRAVLANPFAYTPLLFCIRGVEFDDGLLCALTPRSNVCMESPERFLRNISSNAAVAFRVEINSAPLRGNHAAPHGWRWMREGALAGVAQECFGDLVAPAASDVLSCRLVRDALRVVRGLELVVASRVLEQRIDRWRRVIDRRFVQTDDALVRPHLKSWSEFQPRSAGVINVHKVHASDGHLKNELLPTTAIAAGQQRCLPARLGQTEHRRHWYRLRRQTRRCSKDVQRGIGSAGGGGMQRGLHAVLVNANLAYFGIPLGLGWRPHPAPEAVWVGLSPETRREA
jgi:hypothetical protein